MSLDLKEEYEKIYTFCYFKVKNPQIAEDITQETFLKYFDTNDYLEKGKKLAFLYTIARNCCNDHFRKTKNIPVDINSLQNLSQTPIEKIDISITVQTAISKLTTDEQEIILLKFVNELSIKEIAKYKQISRFAIYRKIKSIEKKLKQYLKKEDFYG